MISSDSYIRAVNFVGLDEIIANYGGDFQSLVAEIGLPTDVMKDFDRLVSFRKLVALIETAAARTRCPNLALKWISHCGPHYANAGPVMLLARFTRNFEDWIETSIACWSYFTNGYRITLIKAPERGTALMRFTGDPFATPSRQVPEAVLAVGVEMARLGTGQHETNPLVVRFQHRMPEDISDHHSIFRCPIEFGCEHSEVEFSMDLLSLPTKGGLRLFRPLATWILQQRIKHLRYYDQSIATTVSLLIPSLLGSGRCNIETIAEVLGMNVKMLQRSLEKESVTFTDILESVRERMARNYLIESDVPISRIAGLLDYSSTAPFTTAFHRWSGETPLRFRKFEQAKRAAVQ